MEPCIFPAEWLDDTPRTFYDTSAYTSGIRFEYAIKSRPRLFSPEWDIREKDDTALRYLKEMMEKEGIYPEDIYKHIWSYNPYWSDMGYEEYDMPVVVGPLPSTH